MNKYINVDDYKELIEREKAECYPTDDEFEDGCKTGLEIAVEVIDEMISADVVEIVKCEDCKYWATVVMNPSSGLCKHLSKYGTVISKCDDFCSYGEREEG